MPNTVFQNMNQITMTPTKGRVSEIPNPSTISCQVTGASVANLYPGTAVVLVAGTANTILVDKATPSQSIFGFVCWTPKKSKWVANEKLEIAMPGSVMEMESAAAFNRGQLVEQVATNDLVQAYAGVNNTVGVALDTATGANQLVRVLIRTVAEYSSSSSSSSCRSSSSSSSSSAT